MKKAIEGTPKGSPSIKNNNLLPLPTKTAESTLQWFEAKKESYGGKIPTKFPRYKTVYPPQVAVRKSPNTVEQEVHWNYEKQVGQELAEVFCIELPNGRVVGNNNTVITGDDTLLLDLSWQFFGANDHEVHSIFKKKGLPPIKEIKGKVALLSVYSSDNFSHWMLDLLPRFHVLQASGMGSDIDYYIINSHGSSFHKSTLAVLGIPEEKILNNAKGEFHIRAEKLVVPSYNNHIRGVPSWSTEFLQKTFLPKGFPKKPNSERFIITRKDAPFRKAVNYEEVMRLAKKYGFKELAPEKHHILEQAEMFAKAECIAAVPHGAAVTNVAFCKPGTIVIDAMPRNWVMPHFNNLSNAVGADYYYFLNDVEHPDDSPDLRRASDLIIDIDALEKTFQKAGLRKMAVSANKPNPKKW